jgi:glutamate formiminotransferase
VQALGLPLASRGRVQVSMNLLDYRITPIPVAFDRVRDEAARHEVAVERGELVGLAPREAFAGRAPGTVGLDGWSDASYLETWLGPLRPGA